MSSLDPELPSRQQGGLEITKRTVVNVTGASKLPIMQTAPGILLDADTFPLITGLWKAIITTTTHQDSRTLSAFLCNRSNAGITTQAVVILFSE